MIKFKYLRLFLDGFKVVFKLQISESEKQVCSLLLSDFYGVLAVLYESSPSLAVIVKSVEN